MHSMLPPKPSDDPHDVVVVAPDAVRVAPSDEELSDLLQQAARYRLDSQTPMAPDLPAGPTVPPVDTTFRPAAVDDVGVPGHRRSVGGGTVRAVMALLLAGCIGGAAFAWRSWGDTAEKKIAKWTTQFVMTASQPSENSGAAAQPAPPAVQADAANAAAPQPAPSAQSAAEAVAPTPDLAQLLQSMARDLASVGQEVVQLRASIEQLRASQQQMSRDVAKASEQNLRARISAPPPRAAAAPARKPIAPYPPPQAAAAHAFPQSIAPSAPPLSEPQTTARPPADPELASVPRPPMPLR